MARGKTKQAAPTKPASASMPSHVTDAASIERGAANNGPTHFPRGSEWRLWDLHVHSPASFHWEGQRFSQTLDQLADKQLVDEMIAAMNVAEPAVFALMDYWTFDGWFALQRRLKDEDAPKLNKTVFPGIELRVSAPTDARLNLHAIFSDKISEQNLRDFLSKLTLELTDEPLSRDALVNYARRARADKLKKHGFKKDELDGDYEEALLAGFHIAELKVESYKTALSKVPHGLALGFVPFNTNDGLASVEWAEHYAYAMSLFETSPIFEARDDATWNAFVGRKTPENQKFIESFQAALGNVPRLPVSGSDSHRFVGEKGNNNKRGYGDYPSGRATWIKADPTWLGLQQAIKEPAKRCFIGELPAKLKVVSDNKTFYIESVTINKVPGSSLPQQWFDGCSLPLNADLVAIIGNKGSGKSALADVVALAGNSQGFEHFSFLKERRFRSRSGEPAKQFTGRLEWVAGDPTESNLAENPSPDRVELVRYIPQGRFEELCNAHVTGKSTEFEAELRAVVFDHLPPEVTLGSDSFDSLIEDQDRTFRARLDDAKQRLSEINRAAASLEKALHPEIRAQVTELLKLKERELLELQNAKPPEVKKPAEKPTPEQEAAAKKIADATAVLELLSAKHKQAEEQQLENGTKKRALKTATERLTLFATQVEALKREVSPNLQKVGIAYDDVVQVTINPAKIGAAQTAATDLDAKLAAAFKEVAELTAAQKLIVQEATLALDGPQKAFQASQEKLAEWQQKVTTLEGSQDIADSKKGLEKRISSLDELPELLKTKRAERETVATEILGILTSMRTAREQLFAPLQAAIGSNELIGVEYDLQFKANLMAFPEMISNPLFSIVKQNVGAIRGEDESHQAIRTRLEAQDMDTKTGALAFATSVHDLLHEAATQLRPDATDLAPLLRKDRTAAEVYDFIYGFDYLTPHYTLMFQGMPIEQLSPGQRGALLLIFYLLVDQGRNPIILDQPEENLDNETVVELLVPVLAHAKQFRQIIMVTHNPNLAVVCDAEQIIMARHDRKDGPRITYESGSIESPNLNGCVVTVLEGTKKAFDNRGGKYHGSANAHR